MFTLWSGAICTFFVHHISTDLCVFHYNVTFFNNISIRPTTTSVPICFPIGTLSVETFHSMIHF